MTTVPLGLVMFVATVNVTLAFTVPLLLTDLLIPSGIPVIVPTVTATLFVPLYAWISVVVLPAIALVVPAWNVCDSFDSKTVIASAPSLPSVPFPPVLPVLPVSPLAPLSPSTILAIVKVSETPPPVALIDRVLNVIEPGATVTVFPLLVTPVGNPVPNVPPFTEYVHELIVVLTEVPTTVKLALGVLTPVFD